VQVKLQEDGGGVLLETASAEIGQGSDTAMAMICAEALGVELAQVRVVSGDTDLGIDLGAYSSRQTLMTGHAVRQAAQDARRQVIEALAVLLQHDPNDLDFDGGVLVSRSGADIDFAALRKRYVKEHRGWADNPADGPFTFREASRMAYLERGTIVGLGKYKPPPLGGSYKGAAVGTSPAYGCSAQVVQLKVDLETGQIDVRAITDAHDCGKAINLTSVEGQMQGSVSMGLGEALFEQVQFDAAGRPLNPNFSDYKIPTAVDMPDVDCIVVESNEPNGPYGAKEVGEGAIMPTIPAVLNALYDATGIRFEKLPVTPEQVVAALAAKREAESG
jgi:4-hydroxybenzoyl-CoA reductase subunit alpha